ncbi:DNA-binding protein, YbaB EbfC family [Liquorilactobacillus oeni DSM 19972]|uniref:Nucleoid-associated protein FD46_GL002005 n=2 Tax=Liquorilactobacillus oeni TaxID=303241 RepID=A0A0R1MK10_9LACO|nr:YbaB/EbfC family nucleoid-associated protein [Liquorilactobacillus oeni]KRL04867.1 DNA-binding protein, YbaB EbfC family [Liquorilactobacillus oeni DSM 19972]
MMRGMGNMQGMMKQMQKMQKNMKKDQEELEKEEFTGKAADEAVVVKFTGKKKMTHIQIKPEAVDPDDVDMLQDLVIMAVNDAMDQINNETQRKMGKYTQNIPGF